MSNNTYSVFYIYSDEDNTWRNELEKQLALLVNEKFIDTWGKNRIHAGREWKKEIERELQKADIVLCLISASLFNDDDAMEQLKIAKTSEKLIIPIILRPCLWNISPTLKDLSPLPKNQQAISTWASKESAYLEVVQEIMDIVNTEMASKPEEKSLIKNTDMPDTNYFEHGYALLIGIRYEHWSNKVRPLNGTLKDIEALNSHFTNLQKAGYKQENIIQLTEENATASNILNALDTLANKTKNDPNASVLVYYSGHGETDGTNYFLVPYDFDLSQWRKNRTFHEDKVVLSKHFAQKITEIRAKKSMIALDCCHAENIPVEKNLDALNAKFLKGFVEELDTEFNDSPVERGGAGEMKKGSGRVILTSCQANETSLDLGTNGLFTQVLLESLSGAENIRKDGWVRLIDLMNYVPAKVSEKALSKYHHQQNPVFKRIENLGAEDFIICAYNIATAKSIIVKPEPPINENIDTMTKEEIIKLIDQDIDEALDALDKVFGDSNGTYNDLANEYFERPDNFNKATYRSKLKRFVKRKM
ncbi:MAG: caspase family protein [Chitinophagales bacterium]